MKKWTKLLSVCLMASVMAISTFAATGCNKKPDDENSGGSGQEGDDTLQVSQVILRSDSNFVEIGKTLPIVEEVLPSDVVDKTVEWSSSDTDIATVSSSGVVTGVAEGTVTITAVAKNGIAGTRQITVVKTGEKPQTVSVTGVSLNKTALTLKKGAQETLTHEITPAGATNQNVSWLTSDDTVATVSNGTVKALKAGTATITVKTEDGNFTATCTVTVPETSKPITGVTVTPTAATLKSGETKQLSATVLPADTDQDKTITWTSSDETVATVSGGLVTAKNVTANKTVTITALAGGQQATCTITVEPVLTPEPAKVESVTVSGANEVYETESIKLTATVTPAGVTGATVTWSSENPSVATVDNQGNVTGVSQGTCKITATAGGKSGYITVTVNKKQTTPEPGPVESVSVTFMSDGKEVSTSSVEKGTAVSAPAITKDGHFLAGWYENPSFSGEKFDFKTPVSGDKTLYAKWQQVDSRITYNYVGDETVAFEWGESNAQGAKVQYKLKGTTDYIDVDSELIREVSAGTARVDVLGLKGNATYDFKITTSANTEILQENVTVSAYDRSGYAHFKYTDGVGAYNDDGTLKDNAVVIYVTDENKDTVMEEVAAKYDSVNMFNIPYCAASGFEDTWKGKAASGIGWWLNSAQYTMSNAGSSKNKVPSNTYDAANGAKLGVRGINAPIVVRFIGTVTVPEGCTAFNSEKEGGLKGDNGNMARMRNCKNITLEGVGEDAVIKGWGFHFMAGSDATNGEGKNFEVRNLRFSQYTEDALGMEGQQEGSVITGPVERCWIHHNYFEPGKCDNPAESDKKQGDGALDFKRGMYMTSSYNYFEYCHKTGLLGSSDSSLQFNITFHHNMWWQCGARTPLARHANIHFYNNYVKVDMSDETTPYSWSPPDPSYVHSLRASSYLFSEANYYDGCKNVTEGKTGGAGKGYNNMYYACFGTNLLNKVSSREEKVANNCSYNGTDYSSFDTNPELFYYDKVNKKSNCYLTDAATARKTCIMYAGVHKRDYEDIDTAMITQKPSTALSIPKEGLTIDLSQLSNKEVGGTVSGVLFVNAKNSSGAAKGKGVLAVFTLAERADITVSVNESGENGGELLNVDGTVIADKFTSYTGTLEAGTYFIASGQKDKETSITALSFKSGVTDAEKVQNVINYIDAIGTVENTQACADKIAMARSAYNALTSALKAQVTNYQTLTAAETAYNSFAANQVIALIEAIGTVSADSGLNISNARTAYNKLTAEQKALVTNYETLTAAEAAYVNFEVEGVNKQIAALADVATADTEQEIKDLLANYNAVKEMYDGLDDAQKAQVTNYAKVTAGITALQNALKPYDVRDGIAELPAKADIKLSDASKVQQLRTAYDSLTAEGKQIVGDITKLTEAEEVITKLANESKVAIFTKEKPELATNAGFTIAGDIGYKGTSQTFTYNGTTYDSPLKIQSSTKISFNTATKMKLTLFVHSGKSQIVAVDGKKYTASNGVIEIEIEAGDHIISKGDGEAWLCYVVLSPLA